MRPNNFNDLLEMQKQLDEAVSEKRENGFIPRERTVQDILFSLDDEFQEWLRELPQEYNFKTWKQREYNREKEIEEFTDILFFFLQLVNAYYSLKEKYQKLFNVDYSEHIYNLMVDVTNFKYDLWNGNYDEAFEDYMLIAYKRKISKEQLMEEYFKKWEKNFKRIKGDWSL